MSARAAAPGPLLRLARVTCTYGGPPVLDAVDLEIDPGSFTGIVGPSGSGKTTLLRVLLGSVTPVAGTVQRRPGLTVAYVPQVETVNWNFPITAAEVVLMASRHERWRPWSTPAERRRVDELLERLGIGGLGGRHIRQLSGGQQQRVFIARALVRRPQLVVLDEPTSGVDVRTRHDVLHVLERLQHDGIAVVLTTHDLNGLATHLPAIVCLNRQVVAAGRPVDVLTPDVLERTYGAPMDVLEHGGMPLVVDRLGGVGAEPAGARVVRLPRRAGGRS
ncbi:MAG: metal ABC transporter ATP-binding protein [Acidimicrobiales bacterium]|nr:metal ABC transporter ATP-binding protein [Acidimicrobiales bacterium]